MSGSSELTGPDLTAGVDAHLVKETGVLVGHADGERVLVIRRGDQALAVSGTCTHYGGPLGEGLVVGDTIRCPLHHACFDLRTGEALAAPALNGLRCWNVERRDGRWFVTGKAADRRPAALRAPPSSPSSIVIVGGGAAGQAAAEMLRREGYAGKLTMLSADEAPPCDRPNLSKDYLAGNAPEEWIPLRPPEFFADNGIELVLGARVTEIDVAGKSVVVAAGGGRRHSYDALLLATGADPVTLSIPGSDQPHVRYLRTLADSRSIIARLGSSTRAVVMGASFIGLEVAASLRARGLEVHVVAPEARPLERVLGPELGDFVRGLHEEHGVVFHLGQTATSIGARDVVLANGEVIAADLVVAGIGVRPSVGLAERAGLAMGGGVLVDEYLETSVPGIFAAGDIARWPDRHTGDRIRVEHWAVAERQGQLAARNLLGRREPCTLVPFFWSQHYDVTISYVGHAERWDRVEVDGSLARRDCRVTFIRGPRRLAVVTVGRDLDSLRAEAEIEASTAV